MLTTLMQGNNTGAGKLAEKSGKDEKRRQEGKVERKAREEKRGQAEKEKLEATEKTKREARKLKEQQDQETRKEKEPQAQVNSSLAEGKAKEAVRWKSEPSKPSTSTHRETIAAAASKQKHKQLSAPSPAEKLEDARRKLNDLKAAEGAKAIEIAGADSSVVITSPLPPEVIIDLYLRDGVSSILISGSSVSKTSVSSGSSDGLRASSSMQKDLSSTSVSKHASAGSSRPSKSPDSAQNQVLASTKTSSSSCKTETKEDLEEEKKKMKEMPEKIRATSKWDTSSQPSTSTQKQLTASKATPSTSAPKTKTKEELEPKRKKTGLFRRITSAMMGRK